MKGKKLIIANWKNHPITLAEAQEILESINSHMELGKESRGYDLVICPPFVFVEEVAKILNLSHLSHQAFLGAQNIAIEDETVLTGEVSGSMLIGLGVRYVIIGHSERRWKLGEADEVVNKKLKSALRNGSIPVVCVGEKTRDNDFKSFLEKQVLETFAGLTTDEVSRCIVAYEPVWAISTTPGARPDTPESALESIHVIKDILIGNWKLEIGNLPRMLYGGSVNSKNIGGFIKEEEIDGVLVGGASVKKDEFIKVLETIEEILN